MTRKKPKSLDPKRSAFNESEFDPWIRSIPKSAIHYTGSTGWENRLRAHIRKHEKLLEGPWSPENWKQPKARDTGKTAKDRGTAGKHLREEER